MKMSEKIVVALASAMLISAPANAAYGLDSLLAVYQNTGLQIAFNNHASIDLRAEQKTALPSAHFLVTNLFPKTATADESASTATAPASASKPTRIAPSIDPSSTEIKNSQILQASVLSALLASAFISKKNSLLEIASSGAFSAIGTAVAIKKISTAPKTAIAAYLLGQNGNDVVGFLKNSATNGLMPAWNLLTGRRTRSELAAILARNLAPIALMYSARGTALNSRLDLFETAAATPVV